MKKSNQTDLVFDINECRFAVRCAVFLRNKHGDILVQKKKTDSDDSWALPGGKLKIGESVINAVIREIREEFGVLTNHHEFLGIIEQNIHIGEQQIHQHNYIYSASFRGEARLCDDTLECKWMSAEKIDTIKPNHCIDLLNKRSFMISNGFCSAEAN